MADHFDEASQIQLTANIVSAYVTTIPYLAPKSGPDRQGIRH